MLGQSRRHAYIASLLGIPHLLVAVNKMDLVDWARASRKKRSRPAGSLIADCAGQTRRCVFEGAGKRRRHSAK